jgi:hypothetical protein
MPADGAWKGLFGTAKPTPDLTPRQQVQGRPLCTMNAGDVEARQAAALHKVKFA